MLSRIRPLLFLGWRHFGASAKWTCKSPSEHLRRLSAPSETGKWTVKDRVTLKKLRKSGKTDEEIASLLGRSVASVKWELPRTHRDPWTEEELCKLDALIAQKSEQSRGGGRTGTVCIQCQQCKKQTLPDSFSRQACWSTVRETKDCASEMDRGRVDEVAGDAARGREYRGGR